MKYNVQMFSIDKFQEDLLTFVDVKDLRNEAIIELEYEPNNLDENEDDNSKQYSNNKNQPIKQKSKCNICSMSFASKDILDFHTEVSLRRLLEIFYSDAEIFFVFLFFLLEFP